MADELPVETTRRLRALLGTNTLGALDEAWSLLPEPQGAHQLWATDIARAGIAAARATGDLYSAWMWLARGHAAAALLDDDGAALDEFEAVGDLVRGEAEAEATRRTATRGLDTEALDALAQKGNDRLADDDWLGALTVWRRALAMIPEPRTDHAEAMWFLASIGDAHHSGGQWAEGERALNDALKCPGGTANGYVWLRLGQCLLEQGEHAGATEALLSAYMLEGEEIFADEDPTGWDLLVSQALVEA